MARDDTTGPIVQIRRRVKARAEQIFDLWTKPDLMARWMSPFPGAVHCKASCDLRPGGAFSLVMTSEESSREVSGTYVEVDRPRKSVHVEWPADEQCEYAGHRRTQSARR
jgi:uncharacterized protein YndB with AHSA1/START domain